jgi:hypothetical protein
VLEPFPKAALGYIYASLELFSWWLISGLPLVTGLTFGVTHTSGSLLLFFGLEQLFMAAIPYNTIVMAI